MNIVYLLASIFIMICSVTVFVIVVSKENWMWSGIIGAIFIIGVFLFVMAMQSWRAPAMEYKANLAYSGVAFLDGYNQYARDCNIPLIQRRIVIEDGMDFTYWEIGK